MSDSDGSRNKREFKIVEMGGNGSDMNAENGFEGRNSVEDDNAKVDDEKSLAESTMGPQEAQEGASGVKVESNGANDNKTQEEAIKGAGGENGIGNDEETKRSGKLNGRNKNPQKKTFAGMIIALVVVLLVAAGLVVFVFLRTKELASEVGDQVSGDGGTEVVEEPEEKPAEPETPEVEELSLDDEMVQRLYGNFIGINPLFDGWWEFYGDDGVKNGIVDQHRMITLVGIRLDPMLEGACVGDYGDYPTGGKIEKGCISGEAVRQKVREMFGQDLELTEENVIGGFCGGRHYDVANDEFYRIADGCGGSSSRSIGRVLMKAEKQGKNIYLYEKAMMFDGWGFFHIKDVEDGESGVLGEKIGEYESKVVRREQENPDDFDELTETWREYQEALAEEKQDLTAEYGDEYKWTFTQNDDGEHIFAGLEKVN